MKIYFHVSPVSKRLHDWRRIARLVKHALQSTLVVEFRPRRHGQEATCIGQAQVSPVAR